MENRKIILLGVLMVIFIAGFFILNGYIYQEKQAFGADDYKDAEYVIEGMRIRLKDGVSEIEASPGSASKITTRYFGNEVKLDLNDDGREDVIFLLTQETGGSGQFYYVVGALNTDRGYMGSEAFLLGDRIAPQTTGKGNGKIVVVNYADRAPGEDFSISPSVGKSVWLILDPQTLQFGQVEKNFEGEANPEMMKLSMKKWIWISALYNDEREVKPKKPDVFALTFEENGRFSATTDCNSLSGQYATSTGNQIVFSNMMQTKMYCEGSDETEFVQFLSNTSSFHFTSKGELILDLKFDSGSVVFR